MPVPYTPKNTLVNGYMLLAHVPSLGQILDQEMAGLERDVVTETRRNLSKEADQPYFDQGYINIDRPRHAIETRIVQLAIDAAGGAAALADAGGTIAKTYSSIANARAAREGARVVLAPDLPEEPAAPIEATQIAAGGTTTDQLPEAVPGHSFGV